MRVFLDANVLLSGVVFRGNEHELWKGSLDPRHVFLVSDDVLREVRTVLAAKFPGKEAEAEEFLRLLPLEVVPRSAYAAKDVDVRAWGIDEGDAHVVRAAEAGQADVVVTGDKALLNGARRGGMAFLRTRDALRRRSEARR